MTIDAVDTEKRVQNHLYDRGGCLSGFSELNPDAYCTTRRSLTLFKGLPNNSAEREIVSSGLYKPQKGEKPRVRNYGDFSGLRQLSGGHLAVLHDPSIYPQYNDVLQAIVDHAVWGKVESSMFVSLTQSPKLAAGYAGDDGVVVSVDTEAGEVMNVGKYLGVNRNRAEEIIRQWGESTGNNVVQYLRHLEVLIEKQNEYLFWGAIEPRRYLVDDDPERAVRVAVEWDELFNKRGISCVDKIKRLVKGWRVPRANQIFSCLRGWDLYEQEFTQVTGVKEGYTQQQHLEAAMSLYERYFSSGKKGWPISEAEFKFIIALHDTGKVLSKLTAGEAFRCYEYGYRRYAFGALAKAGAIRPEVAEIASILTNQDDFGDLIRKRISEDEFGRRVRAHAKELGIQPEVYLMMAKTLYLCDAGTYTTFGAGVEALDYLFDLGRGKLDLASPWKEIVEDVREGLVIHR